MLGVFAFSVSGSPPQGELICLPSPALLLWDPPFATCSWDPGSKINEQIETDSSVGRHYLDKLSRSVSAVCALQTCDHVSINGIYIFSFTSVKHANAFLCVLCLVGWQRLAAERCRMSNNMAKIADARKTVEQLKLEVNIERMMVS